MCFDIMQRRIAELEQICDESYQVLGAIAGEFNVFDHPDVTLALDNLSKKKLIHRGLLPWPKKSLT